MSDNDAKAGAWTEAAKYQFLLRVVSQLRDDGRSIQWSKINMPGRTTKSLQNMWTKINKEVGALEEASGDTPQPTPRKRKGKNDDAADDTPKKNRVGAAKAAAKKPKKEESDSDDLLKAEESD